MILRERRRAWRDLQRQDRPVQLRVAVLSSFTAEPLAPYLGWALHEAGVEADVRVGPYGQIHQECLNPASDTAASAPDVVVVWPRLEDLWAAKQLPLVDGVEAYVDDLDSLVASALETMSWGATPLFVLPAIPEVRPLGVGDAGNPVGVFATATAARESARSRLATSPGVLVSDAEEAVRALGVAGAIDWRRSVLARIPYQEEMFAAMGERIARLITLSRQGAKKVVAVDADNTLWRGVVGEDGAEGVDLADNGPGEAHRQFQAFLLELRRAGAVVALVSKNNDADVWPVFDRPEMALRKTDLAAWRVTWDPKSSSIEAIAEELNLGTDRIVLIDDSPLECAEVASVLPEVQTVQMPADAALWYEVLVSGGHLDRLPPTEDDLARADSYGQESARRRVRESTTLEGFLSTLELRVEVSDLDAGRVARAAQLVAKTNQFTLAGRRRSETEFAAILEDPRYRVRLVDAADRFGDYGTIGVFVVDLAPDLPGVDAPLLDTFALSCRAMGRGVEAGMLADALHISGAELHVVVHEGQKNAPARRFFAQYGCRVTGVPARLAACPWPSHIRSGAPVLPADA